MDTRICLFGDSIGKGIIYDAEKGRYTPTSSSFAGIIGSRDDVALENYSRFGCTLKKGADIVLRRSDALSEYDAVVLEYGGNDSDFDWADVASSPESEHDCNTPMSVFRKTYIELVEKVKAVGGKPVLLSLTPVDSERYFRWISRTSDAGAIMRFLGDAGAIERWNEMYNIAVRDIASICSVPFIDIRTPFLRSRSFNRLFCEDGIHPNQEGHRLIANTICGISM